ncbi:LCP family protein [Butyrivibrio sp. MC2013]|uniref:LCP family protein n=1 Tax=Butyrivibrio sp. MC2013 TaxID=1280686 RepID=UPI0006865C22|nr:LCP family protein [Butyrivibrio sp. MC2013]
MDKPRSFLLIVTAICIFAVAGLCGFLLGGNKSANIVRRTDADLAQGPESPEVYVIEDELAPTSDMIVDSFDGSISYKGDRYEVNTRIDKVLFLGIDSSDQDRDGVGIDEGGRSDVIILFAIDNEKKTITALEINRDTMVDVDVYDNDGNYLTRGERQIAMQYAYGQDARRASNLTREKVSDLLGRTRIDSVMSLTMEGVVPIVDSIGGVTMKLESDATDIDPAYTEGAVIHMNGEKALDFIHRRDVTVRGSNLDRMSRQTEFMLAMFQTIKGQGSAVIETMEETAGDNLYEDVDADSLDHFTDYEYSEEVLMLPGENVHEDLHDEYYVDEDALKELILELFYIKVSEQQ